METLTSGVVNPKGFDNGHQTEFFFVGVNGVFLESYVGEVFWKVMRACGSFCGFHKNASGILL